MQQCRRAQRFDAGLIQPHFFGYFDRVHLYTLQVVARSLIFGLDRQSQRFDRPPIQLRDFFRVRALFLCEVLLVLQTRKPDQMLIGLLQLRCALFHQPKKVALAVTHSRATQARNQRHHSHRHEEQHRKSPAPPPPGRQNLKRENGRLRTPSAPAISDENFQRVFARWHAIEMEFALPRFPPLVKERRQTIPENNGALARKRDRRKSRVQGIGIVLRRSLRPGVDFLPAQYNTGVNDFGSIDRRGGLWHELRESPTRADPDRTIRLGREPA